MTFFIRSFYPLLFFAALLCNYSYAQDIKLDTIVTQDYQKLVVPILEVTSKTITYQPEGGAPVTIPKSMVLYIVWSDGKREVKEKTSIKGISKLGPLRKWNLEEINSEQLQEFHSICKRKSRNFNAIGLVGLTTALVIPAATYITVRNMKSTDDMWEGLERAMVGTFAMGISFLGGTTVAAVGFSKGRNYTRKKIALQEELELRNQPIHSLRLSPGYNRVSQTGYLTVSMSF